MGLRLRWDKRKKKKRLKPKDVEHSKKKNDSFETRYPIKTHKFSIFKHQS
jgi:acyl-ACP thioesterase